MKCLCIFSRSVPEKDQAALLDSGSSILGYPLSANLKLGDIIYFLETQATLLDSPVWLNSIKLYEPIRQAFNTHSG